MSYANTPVLQSGNQASAKADAAGNRQKGDGDAASRGDQFLNLMRSLTGRRTDGSGAGGAQARLQNAPTGNGEAGNALSRPAEERQGNGAGKQAAPADLPAAPSQTSGTSDMAAGSGPFDAAVDAALRDGAGAGEDGTGSKEPGSGARNVLAGVLEQLAGGAPRNAGTGQTGNAGQPNGQAVLNNIAQAAPPQNASRTPASGETGVEDLFARFGFKPEAISEGRATSKQAAALKSPIDATSVKVIRQETHFAPSFRLSPVQQVGQGIVASLKAEASRAAPDPQGLSIRPEGEAVKTLEIKLTPVELGTVKVSLKITGGNVEVTMTASNPQTAEMLKQDRQLLDQMLRATGHRAETITIQAADDRVAGPQQMGQSQSNGASFAQADQNAGNDSFRNSLQQGNHQENREPGRQAGDQSGTDDLARSVEDENGIDQRHDGGVYL